MSKKLLLPWLIMFGLVTGCASTAVTESALTQRTSMALGLPADQFSVSNRSDNGIRTDYSVRTHSGSHYNCYVTGMIAVTGRNVSDAICTEMNGSSQRATNSHSTACNALLRAAGQCQ